MQLWAFILYFVSFIFIIHLSALFPPCLKVGVVNNFDGHGEPGHSMAWMPSLMILSMGGFWMMNEARVFTLHSERHLVYVINGSSQVCECYFGAGSIFYLPWQTCIMPMSTWQKNFQVHFFCVVQIPLALIWWATNLFPWLGLFQFTIPYKHAPTLTLNSPRRAQDSQPPCCSV